MFRFMGNDLPTNKHALLLEYTCKYARKQNLDVYKKRIWFLNCKKVILQYMNKYKF